MATKPTLENIRWATDESNNTAPTSGQRNTGWTPGQVAVSDYFNVLGLEAYRWASYLNDGALTGAFSFATTISPTAITGTQNDYAPTDLATAQIIRQDLSGNATITGLTAGATGRLLVLVNIHASNTITLTHDGAGSTAANRFSLPEGVSYRLKSRQCAILLYDLTTARWRVVAGNGESLAPKTLIVPGVAGHFRTGETWTLSNSGHGWVSTATENQIVMPVNLRVGETITGVSMRGQDNSAGSFVRGELFEYNTVTNTLTQIGSDMDTTAGGTGVHNVVATGVTPTTVSAECHYFVRWESGASGDEIHAVYVVYEP